MRRYGIILALLIPVLFLLDRVPVGAVTVYQVPRDVTLCGEKVPLERPDVWESMDQAFISSVYYTAQVILWIKRSQRYFPFL
ncbi:MAG: hypothetical protein N2Z74_02005 [Syntrophales bacterium]|nr:hypothetical protein [Syntrophales bacterium]